MARENVFLFIPNLIGYSRIILLLAAMYFMSTHYLTASVLYMTSSLLDEFDGRAARNFNQVSNFGAVLDMVTDRITTTCLIMSLCFFYHRLIFLWQVLVALDISSHWIQMYSSSLHEKESHKVTDLDANPILRFYYRPTVLSIACIGNELFVCSLYLMTFTPGFTVKILGEEIGIVLVTAVVSSPIFIMKQFVSIVQLVSACSSLGRLDAELRAKRNH